MQNYTNSEKCRCCGSTDLVEVLDLNKQPLANNYHKGEAQDSFPLGINVCKKCFHTQLSVVVNPDLMFKNYLYVSGTTKTLHDYFEYFVDLCLTYKNKAGKVLDIACNDGTQLDKFKSRGWETYGVDPAENLFQLSSKNHVVRCGYWNQSCVEKFKVKFDIITAQNVFAHVNDIYDFLKNCFNSTSDSGLVFIQTSQADMILDNQFDTIYHEHLSFFSSLSMSTCAKLNGFSLLDIRKTDIHGGSYVFVLQKGLENSLKADEQIEKERSLGLYDISTYEKYSKNCYNLVSEFKSSVSNFKSLGYKVIGYGAAAKGNTFLNFANVKLDYIIDDNPLKQGLFTPGQNIPIKDCRELEKEDLKKVVIIPLAWNFFDEIISRVNKTTGSSLTYLKYFPKLEIV